MITLDAMKTNKDLVWEWLDNHGTGRYAVDEIDAGIPELDRRQIITALHGLTDYALRDRLENIGRGRWRFTEDRPRELRAAPNGATEQTFTYSWPDHLPREVPLGWEFEAHIVSKRYINGRWVYTALTDSGAALMLEPIYEIRSTVYLDKE